MNTQPHLRPDLSQLPDYVPGKRMPDALKLSSNEVAFGPLPSAHTAITDAASTINRYPDMAATELRETLADHLGTTIDHVTVGCGSSTLCQQLVTITCQEGEDVIFPWRSFEAYPIFARVTGANPVQIPLTSDLRNDLDAMADAITDNTRLIFVCNPNNPTGTVVTADEFDAFMAKVPSHIVVALDEAYFEYNTAPSTPNAAELVKRYPNLIGLRTFSKAYGLAGLRIGYAFGNPHIIAAMRKVQAPFEVSTLAQAAALASLEARSELLDRTRDVITQRERVSTTIGAAPSQSNFVWVPAESLAGGDALATAQALTERNVLVRAFPEGVRITVTNEEEMDRFLAAWDSLD